MGVYPRACGGTTNWIVIARDVRGLSPRLRGNVIKAMFPNGAMGSIPALAGERRVLLRTWGRYGVYPRACGGTLSPQSIWTVTTGLSPRLRGNEFALRYTQREDGSIPALAGERKKIYSTRLQGKVYPRACGGTAPVFASVFVTQGLSPRLRGNVPVALFSHDQQGSIPALAGERSTALLKRCSTKVYPRACGGTHWPVFPLQRREGLSPRLRGNGRRMFTWSALQGSIPALAGERYRDISCQLLTEVYPRACGGTHAHLTFVNGLMGLSPRLRGNVDTVISEVDRGGSIPALAGERL